MKKAVIELGFWRRINSSTGLNVEPPLKSQEPFLLRLPFLRNIDIKDLQKQQHSSHYFYFDGT